MMNGIKKSLLNIFAGIVALSIFMQSGFSAVLVIGNYSNQTVEFVLQVGNQVVKHELAAGEAKPINIGREATIAYISGSEQKTVKLDSYSAYYFTREKNTTILTPADLPGRAIPLTDVPEKPNEKQELISIKVKLFVDDANPFAQKIWEPKIRDRAEKAFEIISKTIPVKFEIAEISLWKSDPDAKNQVEILKDFEKKQKYEKGTLYIGFSSRLPVLATETVPVSLGKSLGLLRPHLVLREGLPRSESEQAEFLVHELGHYFGAVISPDTDSVMRAKLGDGRAGFKAFKIRFDILNILAMNIWAEQIARGKINTWQDLPANSAARLAKIYDFLAKAEPTEQQSSAIAALISSQVEIAQITPTANGNPAGSTVPNNPTGAMPNATANNGAKPANSKEQAVRRVLRGISIRAKDNMAKSDADKLSGDALTIELLKTAADVAMSEDDETKSGAFAVALGIGLDDSTILRNNPLTKKFCEAVESNDEFNERITLIKSATINKRRDLCQHFVVSCALTELVGSDLAKQAGLAKELQDMKGASGFSFADLAVDFGGVEFIEKMKRDRKLMDKVKREFRLENFVPTIEGMPEGLNATQFATTYGSISDLRFKTMTKKIDENIKKLNGYTK